MGSNPSHDSVRVSLNAMPSSPGEAALLFTSALQGKCLLPILREVKSVVIWTYFTAFNISVKIFIGTRDCVFPGVDLLYWQARVSGKQVQKCQEAFGFVHL